MKIIKVVIQGVTPLLMNRFTEEKQLRATERAGSATVGEIQLPREQAAGRIYTDLEGLPILPGPNILSGLVEAGKFHRIGRAKVTTVRSSLIPAGISVLELECPLSNNGEPRTNTQWEVDSRPIVNPSTRGRWLVHRPRFDAWRVQFTIEISTDIFSLKFVRQLVDDMGQRIGLGDYRPDRRGPFGKFKVIEWLEMD